MTAIPDIETEEHPNYRTIHVDGILGHFKSMYMEAILYSDEIKAAKALSQAQLAPEKTSIKRTLECRLIIDPFQAKIIANWLNTNIQTYEKQFGRIPSPEELQAKSGKSDLQ